MKMLRAKYRMEKGSITFPTFAPDHEQLMFNYPFLWLSPNMLNLTIIVAALGYVVDIYDLLLFGTPATFSGRNAPLLSGKTCCRR